MGFKLNSKEVEKEREIEKNEGITLDYIRSRASDLDIYKAYLGDFKVGAIYNCPFRKDKNPSFGCYYSRTTKELMFKDHGSGECGNIIKLVTLLTGKTNYNDILMDIASKMNIQDMSSKKLTRTQDYKEHKETVIGVVRQEFTDVDIKFWSAFGIQKKTLKLFEVSSIKYYLLNGIVNGIYSLNSPMFAYKVYNKYKIYRPLGSKFVKWRNNLTDIDIQGYKQLPEKGEILIITKSLKDVMVLYEMGIPAISPSSESTFIPDSVLEQLKLRFKKIYINFDRDAAGVRYVRKMSLKTGLEAILVHKKFKEKDISDAVKNNSFEEVKKWLHERLKIKK